MKGAVDESFEHGYRISASDGPVGFAGEHSRSHWFGVGFVASIRSGGECDGGPVLSDLVVTDGVSTSGHCCLQWPSCWRTG
jgi:hypothetical protein